MEYYAAERKKGAYTLCNGMDGTGEHYAKWNKPGGEGQIPYFILFLKIILINLFGVTCVNKII